MVAPVKTAELSDAVLRVIDILRESGLPGENSDHEWIALRIRHFAENLAEGDSSEYLTDLLITGLLVERGMDPSLSPQLQGRDFPENSLKAVPPLLKIGCPVHSWRLVEKGVLTYEGTVWGDESRWVIRGQMLAPLVEEWHELGEQMLLQHVARGLVPLVHDSQFPPQIKLNGVDRTTGRKWLQGLRSCLQHFGGPCLPHLMMDA